MGLAEEDLSGISLVQTQGVERAWYGGAEWAWLRLGKGARAMLSQECLQQDSQTQELSQNSLVISWPLCYCQ